MKTSELTGHALDWAVAKCEEDSAYRLETLEKGCTGKRPFMRDVGPSSAGGGWWPMYSTDWSQGGPIIEREKYDLHWMPRPQLWGAHRIQHATDGFTTHSAMGPTPLIAALRCYVASKLGDEVEIPEELMK